MIYPDAIMVLSIFQNKKFFTSRDEDPNPVGFVDFWPVGSGTFFIGSGAGFYL